jgi:glutathione S-transferase
VSAPLVLVSHALCPYVQRVAIVLAEKGLPFERRDIDLAHKAEWFLRISPLGKTPVLLVGDEAIFESAVICEYLEDAALPRMHPVDPLQRARHRAWMEFGSAMLNQIAGFYNAADEPALQAQVAALRDRLLRLEGALDQAPYFAGSRFSVVDAVFAPVMRYFDVFDQVADFGFWGAVPRVCRWRQALAARASVVTAVGPDYPAQLRRFIESRPSALARRCKVASTSAQRTPVGLVSAAGW